MKTCKHAEMKLRVMTHDKGGDAFYVENERVTEEEYNDYRCDNCKEND